MPSDAIDERSLRVAHLEPCWFPFRCNSRDGKQKGTRCGRPKRGQCRGCPRNCKSRWILLKSTGPWAGKANGNRKSASSKSGYHFCGSEARQTRVWSHEAIEQSPNCSKAASQETCQHTEPARPGFRHCAFAHGGCCCDKKKFPRGWPAIRSLRPAPCPLGQEPDWHRTC